jgi:hypothetical protein
VAMWWLQYPNALPGIDLEKCDLVVLDGDRHGGPDGRAASSRRSRRGSLRCLRRVKKLVLRPPPNPRSPSPAFASAPMPRPRSKAAHRNWRRARPASATSCSTPWRIGSAA